MSNKSNDENKQWALIHRNFNKVERCKGSPTAINKRRIRILDKLKKRKS